MKILKNILAIILGWIIGSTVNMGIIETGHVILPVEGLDTESMESLAAIYPTLSPEYFIFPFLGHALGALIGALVAGLLATSHKMKFSMTIGILFLLGGIMVNIMIGGPAWFAAFDIIVAYIPMAFIGGKLALKYAKKS